MTKDKDLTVGNPLKLIFLFSASMVLGNVFQQLYTVVDSIIIGKKIGPLGLAAVGGTDWLIFMVNGFLIGLIQGFSVLLGNRFGEKNEKAYEYYYKGIAGAALGTILSECLVMLICGYHVHKVRKAYKEKDVCGDYRKDGIYSELISVGLPMALQSVITAIGGLIVISNVNHYDIEFLTGYTIAGKIYALLEIAASSYGMAVVAYVSQNYGAQRTDRIHSGVKASVLLGIGTALICSAIMFFFGNSLMRLFVEVDTISGDILKYGREYLFVLAIFYPLLYVLYIMRAALQGMGNTVIPMISSAGQLVMRVFCALVLTKIIGYSGIYYGEIGAWILADLILIGTYMVWFAKVHHEISTM